MAKSKRTNGVMLGSWGIGGHLPTYVRKPIRIDNGPFRGHSFPSTSNENLGRLSSPTRLPPLSRNSTDGIDLMPFIIYDKVTIDRVTFNGLIGRNSRILNFWKPSKQRIGILERLASDGILEVVDYLSYIDSEEDKKLIDEMNLMDLVDNGIKEPLIESLDLWIEFYRDLFKLNDKQLAKFLEMRSAVHSAPKDDALFGYAYECISDINRILLVSRKLDLPVYEWEDYQAYYRYKHKRIAQLLPEKAKPQKLRDLFSVFMPDFEIRSYNELIDIRNDAKLEGVKKLLDQNPELIVNKDLVIMAQQDILKMKAREQKYTKFTKVGDYLLDVLSPVPFLGNIITDISEKVIEKRHARKIKWQLFFVERAIKYSKKEAKSNVRMLERPD